MDLQLSQQGRGRDPWASCHHRLWRDPGGQAVKHTITVRVDPRTVAKRAAADDKREAMQSGVVRRAQTFRAAKGAGSYRRRGKYPSNGD